MKDRQSPAAYWYLHTNGTLIKKTAGVVNTKDFDESDFVVKWWYVEYKEDMLVMLDDIKKNYSWTIESFDSFCRKAEDVWGITSNDYFRHAVKEASRRDNDSSRGN